MNRKERRAARFKTITLAVADGSLPTEFRLFVKGWNDTENGRFLFDADAAKSVMSAYAAWGVDLMIDLNHQSLEAEPGCPDPTAHDARGWCKLELRPDGSLWAVNVTWTPDGVERLEQKRQRYVSPAFETDPKTKRVLQIVNVAITAIPATHDTPALVAASRRIRMNKQLEKARKLVKLASDMGLDPSLVKQALDAVEKGDAKAALDILKSLIASAAGAAPDADDGDDDGSEGDGAEGVSAPPTTEAVEDPKVVDNDAAPPPPAAKGKPDDSDDEDDDKPAAKASRKALRSMLCRTTGKQTFAEAVAEVEVYKASHLTMASERMKLAKERAVLEHDERFRLVRSLVTLGAEFPATVWADDKATTLKPRWLKMPIDELRAHAADQKAARGAKKSAEIKPPVGEASGEDVTLDDGSVVQLSLREVGICKSQGTELKDFAMLKRQRDGKGNAR